MVDVSTSLKELALRSLVRSVDEFVQDRQTTYTDVREMVDGLAWWPPEALELSACKTKCISLDSVYLSSFQ